MSALLRSPAARVAATTRVVFYDLETSIVARAAPRTAPHSDPNDPSSPRSRGRRNLIVEIGAVLDTGDTFQQLVDPRFPGLTLAQTFEQSGQNPERTLRAWNRLFREKGMLHKAKREAGRTPLAARLLQYDLLFDDDAFVSTRRALTTFMHFAYRGCARAPLFVAHNGACFDHPILRNHTTRLQLPAFENMHDSLKPARQMLPHMKSHTLGALHKKLVGEPFQAHHALSDQRQALTQVCRALAAREGMPLHCLWDPNYASLTSVHGVGPKTRARCARRGTLPKLRRAVQQHATCPADLKVCIRNHKSLWRRLRNRWHTTPTTASTPGTSAQTPSTAPQAQSRPAPTEASAARKTSWETSWVRRGRRVAFARKQQARSKSV